jgi:4-amino-4-deoxy-L-arabinose transferase-like glycosyltransferase
MKKHDLAAAVALFVLAVAVAALFWSLLPAAYRENQSTDYTSSYEPVARAILAGRGITDATGETATRYPPGFPLLLAGTWALGRAVGLSDAAALLAFRLLCTGLSAVLLYALARLVWPIWGALLVGVVWAAYPFFLWITKQPNSEVPFIPLFFATLFFFWLAVLRRPRAWPLYLVAGGLAGATMLIRPAAVGLGVVLAILVLILARPASRRARLGFATLLLAGNALVVAPWLGGVYAATGEIIPLSSGGTVTLKDGLTFLVVEKEYRQDVAVAADVAALQREFQRRRSEMTSTGKLLAVVLDEARQTPLAFARFTLIKAARSWYGIDSRTFEGPALALQAAYLLLIVWGSVAVFLPRFRLALGQPDEVRRLVAGNWLIVAYFWAMTMTAVPLLRYTLPVMGPLFVALPAVYISLRPLLARRRPLPVGRDAFPAP